jgi:hypothetical protein
LAFGEDMNSPTGASPVFEINLGTLPYPSSACNKSLLWATDSGSAHNSAHFKTTFRNVQIRQSIQCV